MAISQLHPGSRVTSTSLAAESPAFHRLTRHLTQHIDLPSTYGLAWRAREVRLEPRAYREFAESCLVSPLFLAFFFCAARVSPTWSKSAKAPESEFSAAALAWCSIGS